MDHAFMHEVINYKYSIFIQIKYRPCRENFE